MNAIAPNPAERPLEQPRVAPQQNHQEPASEDFKRLLEKEEFFAFSGKQAFVEAQRMAKLLCSSSMVPESFRGEVNLGNCVIAVEIANRIGASVLAVMQNLVIVYGKPSWSAQFLISCLNASKRFSPLRYKLTPGTEIEAKYSYNRWVNGAKQREEGVIKTRDCSCVAWAKDRSTGEIITGPEVSIKMAVEEGWYAKDGSKWKTMPELMLNYRAATFFTRVYAPELTMGIQTSEEVRDIGPQSAEVDEPVRPIFDSPKSEEPPAPAETPKPTETPPATPAAAPATEPTPKPEEKKLEATPAAGTDAARMVKAVKQLLRMRSISEVDLIALLHKEGMDESIGTVQDMGVAAIKTLEKVHEKWGEYEGKLKEAK